MTGNLIQLVTLPKISDDGELCFGQYPDHIPFEIKRIYYIFDSVPNLLRGKHAHRQTKQILFCIRGSVKMVLDDGLRKKSVTLLEQPETGLFLDKMVWHEMQEIKKDTLLLIIASDIYKPEDYIRDYEEFKNLINEHFTN
jgi:dTDP-4-dehydrorhamnose 3,5-epimerase-like enzyme